MNFAILTAIIAATLADVESCTNKEYAALFGDTYVLSGFDKVPYLVAKELHARVTVLSACPAEDSWSAQKIEEEDIDANVNRIVRSAKEVCENPIFPVPRHVTIDVSMPFAKEVNVGLDGFGFGFGSEVDAFIAYPPDGAFELVKLSEKQVIEDDLISAGDLGKNATNREEEQVGTERASSAVPLVVDSSADF